MTESLKSIFFVLSILTTIVANGVTVENKYTKIIFDSSGNFEIKKTKNPYSFKAIAKMTVYDGKLKRNLKLSNPEIRDDGKKLSLIFKMSRFSWQVNFIPKKSLVAIDSILKNNSDEELWLEPGIQVSLSKAAPVKKCWLGFGNEVDFGRKQMVRKGIKGTTEKHTGASTRAFPVSAVFGEKSVVFIGGVPQAPVSYSAASVDKLDKQGKSSSAYSIRTAVLPGTESKLYYVVGTARNTFGGKEAVVQCYYDSMPGIWAPVVGQDNPYIWGAHGGYLLWWKTPDYEAARRLYITNEWTYCAYKRSGDMVCKKELWDYKPLGKWRKRGTLLAGEKIHLENMSREKYLALRRKLFRKYGKEFGLMFYSDVSGTWCEVQLARQKYKDAIVHDKTVPYYLKSWSVVHDHELRVFPMGTSYAKDFKKNLKIVAKDLELPGFAFDCAYSGAYYRGPATKKNLPGRAWDEKGVFIDQGVAINKMVDYIHDLRETDDPAKKLVVFSNGYLKGDYVMIEEPFLGVAKFKEWMPLLRYHIGPRPGCTHGGGYILKSVVTDWRQKTPEDFKKFMPRLATYVIFNEFKYGVTATSHLTAYGVPQVTYCMPEVIEMMRAGWQALIPMNFNVTGKKIYKARYGKGENSFLFIGNPYDSVMKLDVDVDNSFLGDKSNLFIRKMRRQATTVNVLDGDNTSFKAELKPHVPYLYETVCSIYKPAGKLECRLDSEKDLNKEVYTVKFTVGATFSTPLVMRKIRNFDLEAVEINGKKTAFVANNNNYFIKNVDITLGTSFKFIYGSNQFKVSEKDLFKFGFTNAQGDVDFSVIISPDASKNEKHAAELLVKYFDFCAKKKVINKNSPQVKILRSNKIPVNGKYLVINSKNKALGNGVSLVNDRVLSLKATDDGLTMLTRKLEYALDSKYKYIFPFKGVVGMYTDQLLHFKMLGKYLPYDKYFESCK